MITNQDVFGEIASWSIEALDEDITRYFYRFSDVSLIEAGQKNYPFIPLTHPSHYVTRGHDETQPLRQP